MVIPRLSSLIEGFLSGINSYFGIKTRPGGGFAAGFLTGLSLGIVWSPCSGPILAAIAALAATGKVTLAVFVITLAYVLGVGIPLFIIAYGGNRLVTGTRVLSRRLGMIQRGFGIVMVLTAIAIYANYDTLLESKLLDAFPGLSGHLTGLESNPGVTRQLEILQGKKSAPATQRGGDTAYFNADFAAPDFTGATNGSTPKGPLRSRTFGDQSCWLTSGHTPASIASGRCPIWRHGTKSTTPRALKSSGSTRRNSSSNTPRKTSLTRSGAFTSLIRSRWTTIS